ncbi:glycine C-acetyltransferase [Roseibacillus persicicus]|uniref:2-amino-3-ketobutyrate coenzyme A ligase n=1 Tax=Roseibacillus persicicus TaxID=454148 RepID=A0A918TTI0_9BACT|nr:glycine C-acetyltransferase [Roseibacillus persicicus]GHC60424.1 2-amino-3-ketobutyrate coenzyme A ligase [Roseibacillus persicicus]
MSLTSQIKEQLSEIESAGLYKSERTITTPQSNHIAVPDAGEVINLCANNYLGLANHPEVVAAAHKALDDWGFGLASVRFICGTQSIHQELESRLAKFLGTDDCILYSSCFDANGGLFETILGPEDAVVSDSLNHASIIDGIRLCKAKRYRYETSNMSDLEAQLKAAQEAGARNILIATDGVFSMDGCSAKLPELCDLADKYGAMVMMDECHATGFMGETGRGTHEHHDVMGRIDIITGTLGKALGGASGGFVCASQPIIDLLRQRSRPYLFSNSIAPPIVAASIAVLDLLEEEGPALRKQLWENTNYFREQMTEAGFDLLPGDTPIVPVMLYDAVKAKELADKLLTLGLYVIAFSFPVVPKGKARIRTQISAAHTRDDLDKAIAAFKEAR